MTFHLIDKLSNVTASERTKIADVIQAWAESASVTEKRALIEALSQTTSELEAVQAAADRKKTIIGRISAARSDIHNGGRNMLAALEGTLRRAGAPPLDQLVDKQLHEIDAIFASSRLSTTERMQAKSTLFRLGILDK